MTRTYGKTAIKRTRPSRPILDVTKKISVSMLSVLDYGGGFGFDAKHLLGLGADVTIYDPEPAFGHATKPPSGSLFDIVFCTYVLNVIMDHEARFDACSDVFRFSGNRAIITVRRDVPVDGTCTQVYVLPDFIMDIGEAAGFESFHVIENARYCMVVADRRINPCVWPGGKA